MPCCASSGKLCARKILRLKPASSPEKCFIALWTFLLSTILSLHRRFGSWRTVSTDQDMIFFLGNLLAVSIEILGSPLHDPEPKEKGSVKRTLYPRTLLRPKLVGFIWLLTFFPWIVPKWQCPKLLIIVLQLESPNYVHYITISSLLRKCQFDCECRMVFM